MAAMANSMALASRLASMAAPSGELRAWEGGGGTGSVVEDKGQGDVGSHGWVGSG
jgi:hypothetical protein